MKDMTNGNGLKNQIFGMLENGNEMTADKLVSKIERNTNPQIEREESDEGRHKEPKYKLNTIGRIKGACRHLTKQGKIITTKKQVNKDTNVFTYSYKKA